MGGPLRKRSAIMGSDSGPPAAPGPQVEGTVRGTLLGAVARSEDSRARVKRPQIEYFGWRRLVDLESPSSHEIVATIENRPAESS